MGPYDVSIYQDTKFSLVHETFTTNFLTEKTYKPIAHKHPFIICSHEPILHKLTELGYNTFEEYLPVKYDLLDGDKKWQAIIQNVEWMATNDSSHMQEEAEHNYKLFRDNGKKAQHQVDIIGRGSFDNFWKIIEKNYLTFTIKPCIIYAL